MVVAAATPEKNVVLAGRYRLEQRLGAGGMGAIWRAEHLVLRAPVAVKLLERDAPPDEDTVARFMREAQAAATLRSPHVVQIFDYGVDGRWPFIVMELLEGENLAQRIKRMKRLGAEETCRVVTHIARAVARAHEAGIVHRDLKPENVFLIRNEDEEIAKVLDFGVAKVSSTALGQETSRTRTGSILGTPYYMSPEQAQGNKEVDHRSDLWSLAVIAFECMTGTRPFFSDGLGDLVLQICVRDIAVPSDRAPVPPGFDAWFAKAVARDPEHRFQTARELVDRLREALGIEIERVGSEPDLLVSRAEPARPAPEAGPAPDSSRATALDSVNLGSSAPGSAVQVVSARSSGVETDGNAITVMAAVPPDDDDVVTSAPAFTQFSTSHVADVPPPERRASLVPVLAVAFVALALGLVAGLLVLGGSDPDRDQTTAPLPPPAPTRAAGEPRLKPENVPTRRADVVPAPAESGSAAAAASASAEKPARPAPSSASSAAKPGVVPPASASAAPAPAPTPDAGWVKPEWARPDDDVPIRRPLEEP